MNVLTAGAYVLHVGSGMTALVAGTVALIARKGAWLHRRAGTVFLWSMSVVSILAAYLAIAVPGQLVNLFIAILTLYLLATGWMTVHRNPRVAGAFEKIALVAGLLLCAPFAILSFQLATGSTPLFKSAVAFRGPVLVAIYSFTAILAAAVVGDASVVLRNGASGAPRISRHLWRMCLGLTLATGSAFTNGFARLLPGPYHVPAAEDRFGSGPASHRTFRRPAAFWSRIRRFRPRAGVRSFGMSDRKQTLSHCVDFVGSKSVA